MKHPLFRSVIAVFLGILVLLLSGLLMVTISESTGLFQRLPMVEKTFTHTSMLVFSVLFILIINRGNITAYGFVWNLKFPLVKIMLMSLFIGFISSLISILFFDETTEHPAAGFSFLEKILYIWIWASICEEVLTRGLIQSFLSPLKQIGITLFNSFISLPVIVGALFFGAMHFMLLTTGLDIFSVLNIVLFGIILGLLAGYYKERTNSLVPAIIIHFCFNVGGSFFSLIGFL